MWHQLTRNINIIAIKQLNSVRITGCWLGKLPTQLHQLENVDEFGLQLTQLRYSSINLFWWVQNVVVTRQNGTSALRTGQCHQQIRPCLYNKLYQKYNMRVKDYWNLFVYNLCLASFGINSKCPFGAHAYPTAPNELISHPKVFNFVISLYSWDIFHLWGKLWVQTYLPFINCVFWKSGMILINRSAFPFSADGNVFVLSTPIGSLSFLKAYHIMFFIIIFGLHSNKMKFNTR